MRKRRQDLATFGGSLESLPSQQQAFMFRRKVSGQHLVTSASSQKIIQRSSSTVSSASSVSFKVKEAPQPPLKPTRPKQRPSRRSPQLLTFDEPLVPPLRLSLSSSALKSTHEAPKIPIYEQILLRVWFTFPSVLFHLVYTVSYCF